MNAIRTRSLRPRRGSWSLVLLGAALAALVAGCDSGSPTAPPPPLPPLSRVVIAQAGDTLVTADTLTVGGNATFSATVRDTGNAVVNTNVTWRSSNATVFTVNGSGSVSAQGEGAAWLTVAVGSVSDSVRILVLPATGGWLQQTSNSSRKLNGLYLQPDGVSGVVVGDAGELLTTSNAGVTWTRRTSNTAFNLNAVWFTTAAKGFAVGNAGTLIQTVDGGATWTIGTSGASENLRDIWFATPDTGWVVGSNGAILRTVNGGASWSKQNPTASTLNGVAFAGTRYGWAVGDNGTIVGTTDRGLSWTVLSPAITAQALRAVWALGQFQNWAAGAQGVAPRTVNNAGAVDWELRNAGAANDLEGVSFVSPLVGWACGSNGTGVILVTGDGGVSWNPQVVPNGTPLNDVFFVDALRGWAVGDNGRIVHTGNGGQ